MRIEDCLPGRGVIYRSGSGAAEDGVVVGVNESKTLVFVRYRGSDTPKATHPEDLAPLAPLVLNAPLSEEDIARLKQAFAAGGVRSYNAIVAGPPVVVTELNPHGLPDDMEMLSVSELAVLLGGSGDSFTGDLLRLVAKADLVNRAALRGAFPVIVAAWEAWQESSPPTVAAVLERLRAAL